MAEIFDVFISYRRSDGQALARELYSYLDKKGVRVFLDEVKLLDGDFFDTQLRGKLICAPHYVLIGTTEAFTVREGEDWVKNEMELAVDEQEKAAQEERTITVLQPHNANIPDVLPGKLGRAVKVQRIIMRFGVDSDEYFGKVFDVVTKVSKRNLWHSAHRWLEKSKRQGGRFARLHIDESIMPKAGDYVRRGEMPVNVNIDKQDGDEAQLITAIKATDEHLFLIGQGGIGKTTSLMKIMDDEYVKHHFSGDRQIPIFVELSYAPDNDGRYYEQGKSSFIRRSIFKQIRERDFDSQAVLNGVEAKENAFTVSSETAVLPINELFTKRTECPEFLLLLDGLNEVSLAKVKKTENSVIDLIRGEIRYLINECPNVRVILTSRSDDACGYFSELKRLYLTGVDEKSIKKYLEDCKMSQAQIAAALSDEHLKDTLKIPLFLTMYATLKNKDGVCTQGEILRCFFHERRENIGVYTVQDRIARVGENAAASEAVMDKTRLTVEMQNFIIDLILPEIGRYMENNGEFHISRKVLREIVSKMLDGREDTDFCGICGDDAFRIGNRQGATREPSMIADEIKEKFADNKNRITASIIECLIYSLGIMQMNTDESGYGFMHQHIRDFFAAMSYINAMRLAAYLYKDGEKAAALSVMNERFKDKPVGMQVRRFIGEVLGEHHNAPYYDNGWKRNEHENDPLRGLITRTLNIYRGIEREDGGYGVWSLVHILNDVRGELSGIDFSGIDFTRCSLNGMRLSRKGVEARFEKAVLSYNELGFFGHTGAINSAAFSPDGSKIVTASDDNTAKIWDAESFELLGTLEGHIGPINSAAFSHDGKMVVTASWDKTAKIWNAESLALLGTFIGHTRLVNSAAFDDDSKRVITASSDRTVKIWCVESFALLGTLKGHADCVNSALFDRDGKRIVTASDDGTAKIWDAETFEELGTMKGHTNLVRAAAFNHNGKRIVTASWDKTVRVWDAESLKLIGTLNGHSSEVNSAEFSHDDTRIVTASKDKSAAIWDAETFTLVEILTGHSDSVNSVTIDYDGKRILTASNDNTAKLWDAESYILLGTIQGRSGIVDSAAITPDGSMIAIASKDRTVKTWDAKNPTLLRTLEGHRGYVNSAAFDYNGSRIATASDDKTAKIWDAHGHALLGTLEGHTGYVNSAAFACDGSRIVTAAFDKAARIWDSRSFMLLRTLEGHTDCVRSAVFSHDDSMIVTASDDRTAKIWDAESFDTIATLTGHRDYVRSATFNRDGSRIVTASSDRTAIVWDTTTWMQIRALAGHTSYVYFSAFNNAGSRIVTASGDKTAKVWDAYTFKELGTLRGHTGSVKSACFSPDDSIIVTASSDGTIKIWDAETFACMHTIPNIPGLILMGVDLTKLDQRVKFADKEKELLRMYGAKI